MRTIDQILDDDAVGCTIINGQLLWNEDDVKRLMVEYAKEVLDHLMANAEEYIYVGCDMRDYESPDEALFDYEALDKLKQSLK